MPFVVGLLFSGIATLILLALDVRGNIVGTVAVLAFMFGAGASRGWSGNNDNDPWRNF